MSTMRKPAVRLVGEDGNAFAILGRWSKAARAEGWSSEEIRAVMDEAMGGDYDHLLLTIHANSEPVALDVPSPARRTKMTAEAWAAESAAVAGALRVATCGVCKAPVLAEHDPSPIEYLGAVEWGVIHGAFDCTDQPRCAAHVGVSGGGGMATTARCILPENHEDAVGHLAGEPS